jgi:hypothetical protein
MPEPGWLNYVGAITGIIGAVTGVAGAIMGYISYRHSESLKALDLRLELRKAETDLRSTVQELSALLTRAKQSHTNVAAAMGLANSGAIALWMSGWQADHAAVRSLEGELPDANSDYSHAKHRELEAKLVGVHELGTRATRVRDKYLAELAADDADRAHIRADMRARTQAMLGRENKVSA